ncbi:hypothetical protein DSO57_1022213 [Entomophthora muscae]|uniref:Uncharacterized protein n=1 Tax=Entomophthora muscae TaxID=34485 RepID=A0ACC2U1K6_9FUNG|nr:hypothetical protein DSO57_1022213 [Entomophthora muscae]
MLNCGIHNNNITQMDVCMAGWVHGGLMPALLDGLKGGGATLHLVAQENPVLGIQAIPGVK